MSEASDKKIAELERELLGVQQMLYLTLRQVGEPVTVSTEILAEGVKEGTMLDIRQNPDDTFTFAVVSIEDFADER